MTGASVPEATENPIYFSSTSLILKLFALGQSELLNGRASLASVKPYVLFNINYTQGLP